MNELEISGSAKELSVATALQWSLDASVAVTFSQTTSSGYPAAASAAQGAQRYAEKLVGRKLHHIAAFGVSRDQLALAIFTIKMMRPSSTLRIFAGGKFLQDVWRITDVIECVMQASAADDPRAHCVISLDAEDLDNRPRPIRPITIGVSFGAPPLSHIDQDQFPAVSMRLFPCRLLYQRGFRFQINHPSSEGAQIKAAAVREGCDWCPHLQIKDA